MSTDRGESALETPSSAPGSIWRNRDFLILLSGQTVSTTGSSISGITLPLLILFLTGSPAQAGLAGFFASLPYVVLSLPAGAYIDRWNRKRVMILCDLGRAVALGSIPIAFAFHHLTIAQIYVAVLIEGVLFTFFNIAEVAALPRVVPKVQLPQATSLNQAGQVASGLIGAPVGGFIFQVFGKTVPYAFDAVSYLASALSLSLIRTQFQGERAPTGRNLREEILVGLRWLWNQPLIRFISFLTGGLNFVFSAFFLPIIIIARGQGASPAVIGIMAAIASVGGLVGSLIGPAIQKRFTFGQAIIGLVLLQAVLLPLIAIAPNPFIIGIISGGIFLAGPAYNVVQFSYRVSIIPDELQGRVNSAVRLIAFGFQPAGAALGGFTIQWFGAVHTILILSAIMILLFVITLANGHVRNAGEETKIAA